MKRALVTLPEGVWKVIDKELRGKIGDGDSEIIRNLVISHLTEKGYLLPAKGQRSQLGQMTEQIEMLDTMLNSLVEVMEEKGQMRVYDWETKIKRNLTKRTSSQ
jgi:metal-responsive CopG/Arc/MetJ family transcriptional regulator